MRFPKQFSLRTFAIAVLAIGSLLGVWIAGVRKQQAATLAIRGYDGRVRYEPPPKFIPHFAVNLLGEDYFCEVAGVTLYPTTESDADAQIAALKALPNLKSLAIWPGARFRGTIPFNAPGGITDSGVESLLKSLPKLHRLLVSSARISPQTQKKLMESSAFDRLVIQSTLEFGNLHYEHRR